MTNANAAGSWPNARSPSSTRGARNSRAKPSPPSERARIAVATERDLSAIAQLGIWLVARERQQAIVRESVACARCYVAFYAGEPAGFVTWDQGFFNRPFVRLLAVGEPFRRCGIGRDLLARVERAAATYGELFISTEERNGPMRALLERAAYLPSGSIDRVNGPGNAELVYYKGLVGSEPA